MATELRPDVRSKAVERQMPDVETCRDVYSGTRVLREKADVYLPRFPLEDPAGYATRVSTSVLFNGFRQSIDGLVGMVMRQDPVLEDDVPEEIRGKEDKDGNTIVPGAWENIDNAGRHGAVFAKDVLTDALNEGHAAIFVDMPPPDPDVRTRADEIAKKRRPYFIEIRKRDILRAHADVIDGAHVLTSFAYKECITVADGDFGDKEVPRVRDYRLIGGKVIYRIFEKSKVEGKTGEEWHQVGDDGELFGMDRIPVSIVYGRRTAYFESEPPLLDLAFENLKHFQTRSDFDNTLHMCGVPLLFTKCMGFPEGTTVPIGPSTGLAAGSAEADARYVEPSGAALDQTRQALQDSETRMAVLGLGMLKPENRAAETAAAKQMDKGQKDSALATIARSLQDAIEEALGFYAKWAKLKEGGSVTISKKFDALTLTPEKLALMEKRAAMVGKRVMSLETFWALCQEDGLLPDGFDADEEKARIDAREPDIQMPQPIVKPNQPPVVGAK